MMNEARQSGAAASGGLERKLRQEVEQLTYLPGSVSVAIKFIELGKDPDVGPDDYEKTISSDAALGTKILALANSSWYGVRNRVRSILQAITLLGLANIRTLAISYCMAGLHNRMKISKEEAKRYWQASLCKGVAARVLASALDSKLADEAFLAGLFQDMALPLIHSVANEPLLSILRDPKCNAAAQLTRQRETFGVDHCEVGRWLATKLELPEAYVDAIGFHHDADCLSKFVESDALANAIRVAAMFPHIPEHWSSADVSELTAFLSENGPGDFKDHDRFLGTVQKEFEELHGYFEPEQGPDLRLADLVVDACEEIADSTTRMVGQVREMMAEAAKTGTFVEHLKTEHERVIDESRLDALTGVLSRAAFIAEATKLVDAAGHHASPFMILYCDIDAFKGTNDTYGHHFGDFVLRELCTRIRGRVRKTDLIGRLGGDEFAILLNDIPQDRALAVVDPMMRGIREEPFVKGKVAVTKTMSVGVLCIPGSRATHDVTALLAEADMLMYRAKRSGPGQMRLQTWKGAAAPEPA